MKQNIAFLLYLAAGLVAECIPVMLLLLAAGLTVQLMASKKRPAVRQYQQSAQGKLSYLYSTLGGLNCQDTGGVVYGTSS